jgi:ethanolamine utilization microcompartment shell protein EutS
MAGIDLRTFTYIDVLQPQLASFIATVSQGYLPIEGQASLIVEVQPGIDVNLALDVALKRTEVKPGMLIVERLFGFMELHSFDQGEVRAAGKAILDFLGTEESQRAKPKVRTTQIITGVDAHHTMLLNKMRHGQFLLAGQSLYVLEVEPAGYAMLAANEAEKAAPINILEVIAFGAFGRVFLGGSESDIAVAAAAVEGALKAITGRAGK